MKPAPCVGGHDQRDFAAAALALRLVVGKNRVVGGQDRAAAVAEDGGHALIGQHLDDDLRPAHRPARERMSRLRDCLFDAVHDQNLASWRVRSNLAILQAPMRHIIGILLQNEAGALARVAGLFSSRGYNIESLSPTSSTS
jgi:hypothetical protein